MRSSSSRLATHKAPPPLRLKKARTERAAQLNTTRFRSTHYQLKGTSADKSLAGHCELEVAVDFGVFSLVNSGEKSKSAAGGAPC